MPVFNLLNGILRNILITVKMLPHVLNSSWSFLAVVRKNFYFPLFRD